MKREGRCWATLSLTYSVLTREPAIALDFGGRGCIHCAPHSGENEWVQSMGKVLDFKNDDADNGGFHSELYTQSSKGTVP